MTCSLASVALSNPSLTRLSLIGVLIYDLFECISDQARRLKHGWHFQKRRIAFFRHLGSLIKEADDAMAYYLDGQTSAHDKY